MSEESRLPTRTKAKAVVTQEMISRSGPGQTVLDTINVVPGVSFQNNDAYGNAGGTLTMRGFDFDPHQLHARRHPAERQRQLHHLLNFSIDPELIEQVNVNLGSTDVDSPTASAVGGTSTSAPACRARTWAAVVDVSLGEFDYRRFFGMFDTGEFGPWGTRAFIAASTPRTTIRSTITASSTSSSTTPRSSSRSAATATSSRSPATTTRTATISSVRFRCAGSIRAANGVVVRATAGPRHDRSVSREQ